MNRTVRHHQSTQDESIRLFENNFLNALTKVHPAIPLVIFLPAIVYWLNLSMGFYHVGLSTTLGLMVFGVFGWTLFEYSLHRFIFHLEFENAMVKRIHFLFHGIHHDYPNDSRRLVMPPSVSIPLAALLYWAGSKLLPMPFIPGFFAGFFSGYLFYDMSHFAIHHLPVKHPMLVAIRKHHFRHHFQDPDQNYGVSSGLWDYIFSTQSRPKVNAGIVNSASVNPSVDQILE